MRKVILSLVVAFLMVACAPSTKQDYMADFQEFIEKVSNESSEYGEDDWKAVDADYLKYSDEWYKKYEPEMSISEKMQVAAWVTVYNYHKGMSKAGDVMDQLGKDVEKGVKDLGKEIEEIGKSMQED